MRELTITVAPRIIAPTHVTVRVPDDWEPGGDVKIVSVDRVDEPSPGDVTESMCDDDWAALDADIAAAIEAGDFDDY